MQRLPARRRQGFREFGLTWSGLLCSSQSSLGQHGSGSVAKKSRDQLVTCGSGEKIDAREDLFPDSENDSLASVPDAHS